MLTKQRVGAVVIALVMLLLISSIALAAFSIVTGPTVVNSAVDGVDVTGTALMSSPSGTMCIRLDSGHASDPIELFFLCGTQPGSPASAFSCNIPSSELVGGTQLNYSLVAFNNSAGNCSGGTPVVGASDSFTPTAIELASMSATAGGWFYPALLGVLGLVALTLFAARALRTRADNRL